MIRPLALAPALLIGGCQCSPGVLRPECTAVVEDPLCGEPCSGDEACGERLYCGPGGTCTADCSEAGGECGAGATCDHGRCYDDVPFVDGGCPGVDVELVTTIPTIVLLIDQSKSMYENFGGGTRWEAVNRALADPEVGVVASLEGSVRFGATLYTSHDGNQGGVCPILVDVPPVLDNYDAIRDLLDSNRPDGDTPTGEAVAGVARGLEALPNPDEGPRAIVLATDGEPDTCAEPDPQNGGDLAIAAVQDAFAEGIRVYILGVSSDVAAWHLQDMANAGAGRPVDGDVDEPYYTANGPDELAEAFQTIIRGVRDCTFSLNGTVDLDEAPLGDVRLNGLALEYDDPDGWRLSDGRTMELSGQACDTFQREPDVQLTATFPCGAVVF